MKETNKKKQLLCYILYFFYVILLLLKRSTDVAWNVIGSSNWVAILLIKKIVL